MSDVVAFSLALYLQQLVRGATSRPRFASNASSGELRVRGRGSSSGEVVVPPGAEAQVAVEFDE